jgi:hypothetical protein
VVQAILTALAAIQLATEAHFVATPVLVGSALPLNRKQTFCDITVCNQPALQTVKPCALISLAQMAGIAIPDELRVCHAPFSHFSIRSSNHRTAAPPRANPDVSRFLELQCMPVRAGINFNIGHITLRESSNISGVTGQSHQRSTQRRNHVGFIHIACDGCFRKE